MLGLANDLKPPVALAPPPFRKTEDLGRHREGMVEAPARPLKRGLPLPEHPSLGGRIPAFEWGDAAPGNVRTAQEDSP